MLTTTPPFSSLTHSLTHLVATTALQEKTSKPFDAILNTNLCSADIALLASGAPTEHTLSLLNVSIVSAFSSAPLEKHTELALQVAIRFDALVSHHNT